MKSGQLYQTPWRDVLTYKKRQPGSSCYSHEVRWNISKCFSSCLIKEASSTARALGAIPHITDDLGFHFGKRTLLFYSCLYSCLNDSYRTGSFECFLFCFSVLFVWLVGFIWIPDLLVVVLIVLSLPFWIGSFAFLAGGAHTDSFTRADSSVSFSSYSFTSFCGTCYYSQGQSPSQTSSSSPPSDSVSCPCNQMQPTACRGPEPPMNLKATVASLETPSS